MMKKVLIFIAAFSMLGCSNRAVYENVQLHNRNKCSKMPQAEYQECLERASKNYKEYEQEREELLKE